MKAIITTALLLTACGTPVGDELETLRKDAAELYEDAAESMTDKSEEAGEYIHEKSTAAGDYLYLRLKVLKEGLSDGEDGESVVGPQGERGPQGDAGESIAGPAGPKGEGTDGDSCGIVFRTVVSACKAFIVCGDDEVQLRGAKTNGKCD